jgi:hypothetical protein
VSDIANAIYKHLRTMAPHQLERLTAIQLKEAADEIDRLRLTDEEREAVHRLCRAVTHYSAGGVAVDGGSFARDDERAVAVVRGWLARLT